VARALPHDVEAAGGRIVTGAKVNAIEARIRRASASAIKRGAAKGAHRAVLSRRSADCSPFSTAAITIRGSLPSAAPTCGL